MWKKVLLACLCAGVVFSAAGAAPALGQEAVEKASSANGLAGDWALNPALSDDPDDQLRNVRGGARPPGGMPPGAGGRPVDASPLDQVRRAVQGFAIGGTDSTVAIAYPDRELVLFTDGRKQKIEVPGDREREMEYRAWWDGDRLLIERRIDGGITLTETYSAQAGTGRLHVLTRLEGGRLPQTINFMRVYDPSDSGAGG